MSPTRNGKIARLPRAVRQELNRRLDEGEQGKKLVAWLNALPEVQAIIAAEFGGKPIREQNLSEWRQGGYRDWTAQQEAIEIADRLGEDAAEWNGAGRRLSPMRSRTFWWPAMRWRRGAWLKPVGAKAGVSCAKCAATSSNFEKAITARSGSKSIGND